MDKRALISELLKIEHENIAYKAKLTNNLPTKISQPLLYDALKILEQLSRNDSIDTKREIILIISILWTYRKPEWVGLKDYMILYLSRCGFGPTSIMCEEHNRKGDSYYSKQSSLLNEFSIISSQLKNEITIGNETFLLSEFQKDVWSHLKESKLIGISAPTSAGKSFIILLKAIDLLLEKEGNIIYIIPTLSLINQVTLDFRSILKKFHLEHILIKNTFDLDNKENTIYVLTQEKAISAFEQKETPFSNVRLLVVDEIQNLEKVSTEEENRSKLLFDLIINFRNTVTPDITIIAGPRINHLKKIGIEVFGENNSEEINNTSSPVCNITYSISKKENRYFFNQYSDIHTVPRRILIENSDSIRGYGKTLYDENFLLFLNSFVNLIGNNEVNIIFAPKPKTAEKIAVSLSKNKNTADTPKLLLDLGEYIRNSIHPKYKLAELVESGIVFHHGRLPLNIRFVIEMAVKINCIKSVVCTTTLMQGVNLPIQNLIMRNPNLAERKTKNAVMPKLTNYEIANLRGRAGRLMQDFIGRSYILDESSFTEIYEHDQKELFESATKDISTGYGGVYNDNKILIIDKVKTSEEAANNTDISFLTIYIRQSILKYGKDSLNKLKQVGIDITEQDYFLISKALTKLTISNELCFKNRYWDPFTLQKISLENDINLPVDIFEKNFVNKFVSVLMRIYCNYKPYFMKYLKIYNSKEFSYNDAMHIALLTKNWIEEKSLYEILSDSYYDNSEKIGNTISELNQIVTYGLPRLLKPFYDILEPNSNLLSYFERGVCKNTTKELVDMNIPRETAIYLQRKYFNKKNAYTAEEIKEVLYNIRSNENYWLSIQFEHLL